MFQWHKQGGSGGAMKYEIPLVVDGYIFVTKTLYIDLPNL